MKESFVKLEVAIILKKIGFNEPVNARYNSKHKFVRNTLGCQYKHNSGEVDKNYISAPTQTLACDWIRENLRLSIHAGISTSGLFQYNVWDWKGRTNPEDSGKGWEQIKTSYGYESFSEAIEEGIIFVFKLLGFITEKQ